jgi:hypothetical protein
MASKSSLREELILHWKEFIGHSTTLGIVSMQKNNSRIFKLMWLILFLGSTAFCSLLIVSAINSFLMYDVTTTIQIKPKNPIKFPIIKICDVNFFSTEYAKELIREYFNSSGIQNPLNVSTSNKKYIRSYLNFLRDLVKMKSFGLSKEEKKKFSMEFNKIMISCSFGNAECLAESFIWEYIDDLPANCFTFNSGLDSNSSKIKYHF